MPTHRLRIVAVDSYDDRISSHVRRWRRDRVTATYTIVPIMSFSAHS